MVRRALATVGRALRLAASAGLLLAGLACSCEPRTEEPRHSMPGPENTRASMPDSMRIPMDSMPAGPPEDSMAAQMQRAFEEGVP